MEQVSLRYVSLLNPEGVVLCSFVFLIQSHVYYSASGRAVITSAIPFPPRVVPSFYRAEGSPFPTLADFSLTFANSCSHTFG